MPSPTATDAPGTATAPPAVSGSAETDREALVALYNATNGENWRNNDNWLSDAPLGEWYGVNTDDDGRVKTLVFDGNGFGNGLSGEIPAELGSLSNLIRLSLSENALSGEIPAELGSLSYLKWLRLGGNSLSGCVPSSLEDQLNFDASYLGDLPFCGTGSAETDREALVALYNATNDENWRKNDNWLSDAPIGEWYGVVTNDDGRVIALVLSTNNLSGEIPAELGSLSNLQSLWLNHNGLSGEIPAELGSLSYLKWLRLGGNSLSGCVPSSLEDQLKLNFDASYLGDLPFCGTGSAETDREALVALYKATNDENWRNNDNWLSDAPIGEWYGVVTNDDGRVTGALHGWSSTSTV